MYDIGCFIGAIAMGFLADGIGRERFLALAAVIFIIGAVVQAASYTIVQIVCSHLMKPPSQMLL